MGFNVGYAIGTKNKILRNMFELPPYYLNVIIGLAISDVGFQFTKYKGQINSCRLALEMNYKSLSFILSTFFILSPYCSALPKLHIRYRAGSK
jgi:hypothetical protein